MSDEVNLTVHPDGAVVDPGDVHADGRHVRVTTGSAGGAQRQEGREAHEAQCEFLMRGSNPHSGRMFPASAAALPGMRRYTQLTVYKRAH